MEIGGVNILSIGAAGAAGFVFAAVYYTVFGGPWQRALGMTEDQMKAIIGPACFITAAIAQLTMAAVLAGTLFHFGPDKLTIENALLSAALLWLGFVITTLAVNHRFQGAKWSLTIINGGNWLGVLLVQGLVLSVMGI